MKRNFLILFISFISFQNLNAQFKVEQLIGTWKSFETESERMKKNKNTPITERNESDYKSETMEVILKFDLKNKMEYSIDGFGEKSTYKLKGSILTLGNRKYTIIKLTEKLLTLKDDLFSKEENYKRIENKK